MDGTKIRDIARAAGVSAGLVRHHFGSKEALRDACDSYALDRLMRIKEQALLEGHMADPGFLPAVHPTVLSLYRYSRGRCSTARPRPHRCSMTWWSSPSNG